MKPIGVRQFSTTSADLLTRPWNKYRNGTLFYGLTKTGNKRIPLTTKQGNKTMYKGTRASGIGKHTKHGDYVINWQKVCTFVTPQYYNEDLKPLVSANVPELKHQFQGYPKGAQDTKLYFDKLMKYIKEGRVQSEASDVECHIERG